MAKGKKSVMLSLTAPYSETAMKILLGVKVFPVRTKTHTVKKMIILLATKKDAIFRPRRYELVIILEISFLKKKTHLPVTVRTEGTLTTFFLFFS